MPVLNLDEDERNAVVAAPHHERVRLTGEWSKAFDDEEGSGFYRDSELERLAKAVDLTTDLRRKIEVAVDITKAAWHNQYGWLTKSFFEFDRGKAAYESALQAVHDNVTAPGLTPGEARDQMSPGTWNMLPDELDVDAWPYEETDPDEKIVIASADTQTDGTLMDFYTYDLTPSEKQFDIVLSVNGKTECIKGSARDVEQLFKDLTSDSYIAEASPHKIAAQYQLGGGLHSSYLPATVSSDRRP